MKNTKLGKKHLLLSVVAAGVMLCQSASAMDSAPSSEGRSLSLFPVDFVTSELHRFFKQTFEGPLKEKLSKFDIKLKIVLRFVGQKMGQMKQTGESPTTEDVVTLTKLVQDTLNALPTFDVEEEQEIVFDEEEKRFIQKADNAFTGWLRYLEAHPLFA